MHFIFIGLLFTTVLMNAQNKKVRKADKTFDQYAYADAIGSYESLIKEGYASEDIYKRLGDANYLNAKYGEAANWYAKLFESEGEAMDPEYMYRYAQALKSMEKYEESDNWMKRFEMSRTDDSRGKLYQRNTDYLETIEKNSGRYTLKKLGINSKSSDFAPAFHGSEVLFSTARDTGVASRSIHLWNKESFLNLYSAPINTDGTLGAPTKFPDLNKKTHESSTALTQDGNTLYFTRNNSKNNNFSRDNEGVSRLKIYKADLVNGKWTNNKELPFNSDDYSVAHPALSPDGKRLYFVSDMPGSIGDSDIFMVEIKENGSFGKPKNLGPKINTKSKESFPYITSSNVLYFASDGRPGLGGLDIYATKLDDLDNLYIVNVGKPVNTQEDDFSFIIDDSNSNGFFASNRKGGAGSDDIYAFKEDIPIDLICNTLIDGSVVDKESKAPLNNAKIAVLDSEGSVISETVSDTNGSFSLEGNCKDGQYTVVALKEEYDQGDTRYTVIDANNTSGLVIELERTIKKAGEGEDLIAFLGLDPVRFDLDKSNIRPDAAEIMDKVVEYMNYFPDLHIAVRSHTDVRASISYNDKLSQRRAKETIAYLVTKGIAIERLTGTGLGESQLLNNCTSRSKCTDVRHEENRRSEFIVIE